MTKAPKIEVSHNNCHNDGTGALTPQIQYNGQISGRITKKIGGTIYKVSMYYSETSRENLNDKISRLIKNEALNPH